MGNVLRHKLKLQNGQGFEGLREFYFRKRKELKSSLSESTRAILISLMLDLSAIKDATANRKKLN